jgi:hypothetical protein
MRGRLLAAGIAASLPLVLALPAVAATPRPDARYAGTTSQGRDHAVSLRTRSTRSIARLRIEFEANQCRLARQGTQGAIRAPSVRVRRGSGRFVKRGSERAAIRGFGFQRETYRVRGRFTTRDRARGTLRITVRVFNRSGLLVDQCTTARPIRWSVDRLGDISPPYQLPGAS